MSTKNKTLLNRKIISERVKYLRALGAPLSTARGYDLRKINQWSYQRLAAIDRFSEQLDVFIEETMPLTGAVYVVPRSARVRRAIQSTFYRDTPKPKWLRGEIVPNMGTTEFKLSVDKDGNLIYRDTRRNTILVTLNPVLLATDTANYFKSVYDYMRMKGGRVFVLKAGNNYFKRGGYNGGVFSTLEMGRKLINGLLARYSNTNEWLHTIEAHLIDEDEFEDRAAASSFVRSIVAEHNADTDAIKEQRYKDIRKMMRKRARQKGNTKNIKRKR